MKDEIKQAGKVKFIENIELIRINNKTGKIIDKELISNTIVNDGLERIAKLINGVSSDAFTVIGIGEGTTSPTTSDTELESEVTRATATCTYEADYKTKYSKTFTFSSGEEYEITEVGIFDSLTASGSTMLNRVTFSAKIVTVDISLIVTGTIIVSRA